MEMKEVKLDIFEPGYLPTKEQLVAEINKQKEIFALQAGKKD